MSLTETANRYAPRLQLASILVIVVSLLLVARSLPIGQLVGSLEGWIDGLGLLGPVVFVVIYVAATVLFAPGSVLTLASGAIFGLLVGFVAVSVGATLGAGCAFLIARYVARDKVAALAAKNRKFDAIDKAVAEGGWKIVALLRLSPAIPFNLQNYLFGLTPVGFFTYLFTSWIAMMPGTFLYVYLGHITGAAVGGQRDRTTAEWVALVVGLLATVAVTVYVTLLAKRKLAEQTALDEAPDEGTVAAAAPAPARWPWGATVTALVAVALLAVAGWAQVNPTVISGLFGPPPVELEEAYGGAGGDASFDHSAFERLLTGYVDGAGWVDYEGLAGEADALDGYLEALAAAPFDGLDRDEKLALLINAYNAFTLKLILDHWPVESIKDIPAAERWEAERWRLAGETVSLNQLEHERVRPRFAEPRVHFVLVCAAVGCPPLPTEAFTGERLEEQLHDQSVLVHSSERWLRVEPGAETVHLTSLYDWYAGDFEQVAGSVLEFVARYSDEVEAALESGSPPAIEWIDYDWSLNRQQ